MHLLILVQKYKHLLILHVKDKLRFHLEYLQISRIIQPADIITFSPPCIIVVWIILGVDTKVAIILVIQIKPIKLQIVTKPNLCINLEVAKSTVQQLVDPTPNPSTPNLMLLDKNPRPWDRRPIQTGAGFFIILLRWSIWNIISANRCVKFNPLEILIVMNFEMSLEFSIRFIFTVRRLKEMLLILIGHRYVFARLMEHRDRISFQADRK